MHYYNHETLKLEQSERLTVSFLDNLCHALDLTKTQRAAAEQKYSTVTKLLADSRSILAAYSPHLFPQGSFLLKTVVKPMANVEYDVDLICLLQAVSHLDASTLFELVKRELKAHYKDLEVKELCCRIDFAGEFHMDIIPARHEGAADKNRIVIPNRLQNKFVWSCPKLFAEWFDEITKLRPVFIHSFAAREFDIANAAVVEKLPEYDGMDTEPLRRFVQLFKASRNHFYEGKDIRPPSSIAITTLAAHSYRRAVIGSQYQSMIQVFRAVAQDLHNGIQLTTSSNGKMCYVLKNPKDERENLLDCWEGADEAYTTFLAWQKLVVEFIDGLSSVAYKREGIDGAKHRLSAAFGDSAAIAAIRGVASHRQEMVTRGSAGFLGPGFLTTTTLVGAKKVPLHTFDGRAY